jgi:hypothetical protein
MNLTEDLKSTLNKSLEVALGIEKVNNMINPQKAHTDGKNIVNIIYKDIQTLSNQSNIRTRFFLKSKPKVALISPRSPHISTPISKSTDSKKQLALSIKSINQRLKMTRAGKKTVGQVLNDESLPFNQSFHKTLNSRINTPRPSSLPFVSLTTGKTENYVRLPGFQEYLENKGSNYLKLKLNDELLGRFDRVSNKIKKFSDEFEIKAISYAKTLENKHRKTINYTKRPSVPMLQDFQSPQSRKKTLGISNLLKNIMTVGNKTINTSKKSIKNTRTEFHSSIADFKIAKQNENQKLLDILNKIDLERPLITREKVNLIQKDNEKYKNNLHSLKKFRDFRLKVESGRRKRQGVNESQGNMYMKIIEEFRIQRYKPTSGELEILEFWKRMVEYGWVITKPDLDEIAEIIKKKEFKNENSDLLLKKLYSTLAN